MNNVFELPEAGYSFLEGVFQYSAGVRALSGYRIERACFQDPISIENTFDFIAQFISRKGRPVNALCALEFRSPAPMSELEFQNFNQRYVSSLKDFEIIQGELNPVARTNVCPHSAPPSEVCCYAFSYTMPDENLSSQNNFVISGSGEVPEGKSNYRDYIVRLGDHSAEGLREKAKWVLRELERRMDAFQVDWSNVSSTQVYTTYNIHHLVEPAILKHGAMNHGLNWYYSRPPIKELDFEMDARNVSCSYIIGNRN